MITNLDILKLSIPLLFFAKQFNHPRNIPEAELSKRIFTGEIIIIYIFFTDEIKVKGN